MYRPSLRLDGARRLRCAAPPQLWVPMSQARASNGADTLRAVRKTCAPRALIGLVGLVGLVGTLVWAARAGAADDADVRAGRDLFEQHCEVCHGSDGSGHGPLADDLRVPPADLTGIALRRAGSFPEVEVAEIIDGRHPVRGHGGKEMPIWGRALGGNIADPVAREAAVKEKVRQLVAYLRSIQRNPPHTVGMSE